MRNWIAFGLTGEQEDRYRSSCLPADLGQAKICGLFILAPLVGFLFNDYRFFGLSWPFYGLAALRLGLFVLTALSWFSTRAGQELPLGYSGCAGLGACPGGEHRGNSCHTADCLSRPFGRCRGRHVPLLPRRPEPVPQPDHSHFGSRPGRSGLISLNSQRPTSQASIAILTSVFLAGAVALTASWQFNSYRRKAYAAGEKSANGHGAVGRDLRHRPRLFGHFGRTTPDRSRNRPMAEHLGVTAEQCIGLHCYEAVHGTAEPPEFCPHWQTCRDGQEHTREVHEPRLGGHFLVSTTRASTSTAG